MKTNLIHSILTILVVTSLFVPAIIPFVHGDGDAVMLLDLTEEEHKKESKKELDEKEVYFLDLLSDYGSVDCKEKKTMFFYFESPQEVLKEILLPPPELQG